MVSVKKFIGLVKFAIGWPLGILAIVFILKFLFENSSEVFPRIQTIRLDILALSFLSFFAYYALRILAWQKMMEYKNHKLSFKKTSYAWEFSEIKRYVPGNIWSFLSRAKLFEDLGVPKRTSGKLMLSEVEFLVISNFILSLLALPLIKSYLSFSWNTELVFTAGVIGLACLLCLGFLFKNAKKILPDFGATRNSFILLVYVLAFFFFALGTYFAALSVLGTQAQSSIVLIGFFAFSYIVGYLSIITPSGIGVREAIVTFGLSSTFSVPIAGLIAIFTRIILVASEVLFALIILLWKKTKYFNF